MPTQPENEKRKKKHKDIYALRKSHNLTTINRPEIKVDEDNVVHLIDSKKLSLITYIPPDPYTNSKPSTISKPLPLNL